MRPSQAGEAGGAGLSEVVTLKGLRRSAGEGDREVDAVVRLRARLAVTDAGVTPADPSFNGKRAAAARRRICAVHGIEGEHAGRGVAGADTFGDRQDERSDPVIVDHVPGTRKGIVSHVVHLPAAHGSG